MSVNLGNIQSKPIFKNVTICKSRRLYLKGIKEQTITDHYDVIIIGTGAGGGTLAYKLAGSGTRILLLERGEFLPREKENWDATAVFVKNKYTTRWNPTTQGQRKFTMSAAFAVKIQDQLYIGNASFFVSSGAVNPSLTIMANALVLETICWRGCHETSNHTRRQAFARNKRR